jgi:AcrR family transcriptional regulator
MGTRATKLMAKHELVLRQAGKLFYSSGYESTAMKDIAEACNLGMNAIYSVFGSKEQICAELFLKAQAEFVSDFKRTIARAENLPSTNLTIMNLYIDFYSRHNFLYEIVWMVLSGQIQAELKEETVALIHGNFIDLLNTYRSYLEQLAQKRIINCELDLSRLTSTFWCMMSGLAANYVHKTGEITGVANQEIRDLELDMVLQVLKYDLKGEK